MRLSSKRGKAAEVAHCGQWLQKHSMDKSRSKVAEVLSRRMKLEFVGILANSATLFLSD
ncbi:MAG TPA: hypothetical protein VJ828_10890 [Lacipirellulaceae bacterium]|nr:hypothetical protein [Lacipirellulaceae bacterium]